MVQLYRNNKSLCLSKFSGRLCQFNRPTEQTIRNVVKKFEEAESIGNRQKPVHRHGMRLAEYITTVSATVDEIPGLSICRSLPVLGFSHGSLWRLFHQPLHLHP